MWCVLSVFVLDMYIFSVVVLRVVVVHEVSPSFGCSSCGIVFMSSFRMCPFLRVVFLHIIEVHETCPFFRCSSCSLFLMCTFIMCPSFRVVFVHTLILPGIVPRDVILRGVVLLVGYLWTRQIHCSF